MMTGPLTHAPKLCMCVGDEVRAEHTGVPAATTATGDHAGGNVPACRMLNAPCVPVGMTAAEAWCQPSWFEHMTADHDNVNNGQASTPSTTSTRVAFADMCPPHTEWLEYESFCVTVPSSDINQRQRDAIHGAIARGDGVALDHAITNGGHNAYKALTEGDAQMNTPLVAAVQVHVCYTRHALEMQHQSE